MKKFIIMFLLISSMFLCFGFSLKSQSVYAEKTSGILTIECLNKKQNLNFNKYKVKSNIHTVEWEASKFNRKRASKIQAKTIDELIKAGAEKETAFDIVFNGIKKDINLFINKINTDYKNATAKLNGETFSIEKEKIGYSLNKNELYEKILNNLKQENFSVLRIEPEKLMPKYYYGDIAKSLNLRSEFKTNIERSTPERKHNIALALSKFNGKSIFPGETLSFNKMTGARNKKNGYKEAKIIVNGVYTDGIGGGVCQASTTLYNAAVLSGITANARNHTLPPSYVKKGLDAMVNSNGSDLKITNNLNLPVFIKSHITESEAVVKFYGSALNEKNYKTKSVIIEEMPSKGNKLIKDTEQKYLDKVKYQGEQFQLQYPTKGYKTATYLLEYNKGKLVKETLIRKDVYPATEGIIIEGILPKPAETLMENISNSSNITDALQNLIST